MKNLIDVSRNVLHIEYNSREFDAREYPRGRDGNETKIKCSFGGKKGKGKKKSKKETQKRVPAVLTRS